MITKGIIKTIDYNNNSCKVRIPLYETPVSAEEAVFPAVFLNRPGMYNGYNEGDIVFVGFENDSIDEPIILGKLYLGASKEEAVSKKGGFTAANLHITEKAILPLDTQLAFDDSSKKEAKVKNGLSSYKSLIDIINSLQKNETFQGEIKKTNSETISSIKIEYLSQPITENEPSPENNNWQTVIPDYKDRYAIWQKTTSYNHRGQILNTEIICLSNLNTAASYWIKCSTRSHSGSQQNRTITITAMVKLGSNLETDDTGATLEYRWSDGSTKQPEVENPDKPYELKFINTNEAPFPNADLIITAKRNGVEYESETISFMPLNTPILILSNESDWIEYDSYGINKINQNASVESTAKVMLNNEVLPVKSITWEANNSECTITPTDDINSDNRYLSSTVKVSDIEDAVDTTYVTCTAIYVNNLGENNTTTLTKRFSVAKNKAGKSAYEVVIENDFVSIPATSDGTMTDFNWTLTKHKVTALYGDKILACTCSDGDGATTQDVHLKYTLSNGITLANTPSASESKTPREIQVASLSGKTGSITYELFKKGTKVASSKFEIIRVDAGEPSTSYSLICSHSNINIAANGTISPNVILVGVSKKRGNEAITRINTDNLPLTRDSAKDLYLRVKIGNTYQYRLETNDEKTDYKISTASVYKNTPITIELVLKGNTSADDIIIDRETISAVEDGKGGDSIRVYQAFCWTDDYLVNVIAPNNTHTELATTLGNKNIWATLENAPTRENMNSSKADWKLVYLSSCTETIPGEGSSTEASISVWTAPEVFLCKDPEAYRILTTAEGLFGYGQGVYYTPTANNTVEKPKNNPTDPTTYYSIGEVVSQSYAAEWVAGDPTTRKDDLELYINAEYIKTGSFTVGDTNNPLFQAGLDSDNVSIGGFTVNNNKLTAGSGASTITLQSKSDTTEFKSIYLGNNDPEKAPFSVTNTGKLKATKGTIGGFDITETVLRSVSNSEIHESVTELYKIENVSGSSQYGFSIDEELKITNNNVEVDSSDYVICRSNPHTAISTYILPDRPNFSDGIYIQTPEGDILIPGTGGNNSSTGGGTSSTTSSSYTYSTLKLTFKEAIPYFKFYIASSAESNYDYIMVSSLNAAFMPTSYSSGGVIAHTWAKQTSASNGEVSNIELTATNTVKVSLENIKDNDYVYVTFRKDASIDIQPDCGWLILPNTFTNSEVSLDNQRHGQIWLTPSGSDATVAGVTMSDWGITVGKKFGINLSGNLFAEGASLKGGIIADSGSIGAFDISDNGLETKGTKGIQLQSEQLTVFNDHGAINLGVSNTEPYIKFNQVGSIYGPGDTCGFTFSSTSGTTTRNFLAQVSRSGKNITVSLRVAVGDKWDSMIANDATRDLFKSVTIQTTTWGVDRNFFGVGTNIVETLTFTFSPGGTYSSTKALHQDFDEYGKTLIVTEGNTSTSYVFEQKKSTASALTSIGSIIPRVKTCNLGSNPNDGGKAWGATYSHAVYAEEDGYGSLSDKRKKTNISYDLSKYEPFFDGLKPTSYRFVDNSSGRTHLGFIAQDVEQSLFKANMSRKDGAILFISGQGFDAKTDTIIDENKTTYGLKYAELHALEVDQIQKLKKRVSDQEQIIKDLETRIKNLETK